MSPWEHRSARVVVSVGLLLIALVALSVAVPEVGTAPASVAVSERSEEAKPDVESKEGTRRPLQSLLQGATPEEHARLEEERKRLSAAAKASGTDPTAIIGYYQLNYGHSTFTNNLRLDNATAVVQLPVTPNWVVRATLAYVWADLNQPRGFTTNGAGDLAILAGGRVYASPNLALFVGANASFPTGSNDRLSTGKYTLGPIGGLMVPLPRLRSLFLATVQDFNSVGGDPGRADIHFMQVQSNINTIWSERWWTLASMTWNVDWNNNQKTAMNLLGQVGYRFADHWNVFAGSGVGVVGKETSLGLDWQVLAGVRWVFSTPLFSEKLVEELPIGR
jgi:opacity protein-like surface antigen